MHKLFTAGRIFIGLLFILSGLLKMTDLVSFADSITRFGVLPSHMVNSAAVLIPAAEVVCGIFLILKIFMKGTLVSLGLMLIVFTAAISLNIYRGNFIECGCFGSLSIFKSISFKSILFNVSLLGLLISIFIKENFRRDLQADIRVLATFILPLTFMINLPFKEINLINSLSSKNLESVSLDAARHSFEEEGSIIIDARPVDRYDHGHVRDAVNLPYTDFTNYYADFENLDKNTKLFVYCDGLDCNAHQAVAYKLIRKGHESVYIIKGGWREWKR